MTENETTNGNGLPKNRQAVVEAGLAQYQTLAARNDELETEIRKLRLDIELARVADEQKNSRISELESRAASAYAVRDEAVKKRAELEATLIGIKAQLNAFDIPSAPFIREIEEPQIGGA